MMIRAEEMGTGDVIEKARIAGKLIDVTDGNRIRAVLIMKNGEVVISPNQIETLKGRVEK